MTCVATVHRSRRICRRVPVVPRESPQNLAREWHGYPLLPGAPRTGSWALDLSGRRAPATAAGALIVHVRAPEHLPRGLGRVALPRPSEQVAPAEGLRRGMER